MADTVESILGPDSVASVLDGPSTPAQPKDWKPLFSGVDSIGSQNPVQQKAVDFLNKRIGSDKETRAQAANMSYVSSKTPLPFSWMQQNWPSVRDAYAKEAGFTQGELITDSTLYGHIGTAIDDQQHIHDLGLEFQNKSPLGRLGMLMQHFPEYFVPATKEKTVAGGSTSEGEAKGSWWQDINKPFIEIPEAPKMPDAPGLGVNNPALIAGTWNGVIRPLLEGVESKVGVATLGVGGASKAGVPLAKQALLGITGLFTGLFAKDVAEKAPSALKVVNDPNASTQEKIEAVGPVLTESTLGLLGAFHLVTEVHPGAPKVVAEMEGKNPQQAAEILRKEANTTPDPKAVDALNQAADKLEEIPSPAKEEAAVKEEMAKQEEAKVEREPQPSKEPAPESNETASAPPPEPKPVSPADVEKAFSIKNKAVAKTLKEMGEEPATKGQKNTWELATQDAKEKLAADPEAGMKLVDELMQNPRPVTGNEDALLAHEVTRLELEREAAREHLKQAEASGDENAIAQAQERVRSAKENYQNSADVFAQVGTANAHGLSFRAMMLKEDYSLAKMEREYTEATGAKELNPEQTKLIEDLHQNIKDTQAKFDAYRSRASELLMNPDFPGFKGRSPKPRPWIVKAIGEQAEAARERIRHRYAEGRVQSGLDPADLYDHAVIGAEHIVKGLDTFADWSLAMIKDLGDRVKPHLSEIWEKAREIKDVKGHEKFVKQQVKQLEKRIAELEAKLKVNDLSVKPVSANRPSVQEIENLKQARDALNEKMAEARKEDAKANAPTEEEKRLEAKKGRLEKTRKELQRRINEHDLTPKQKKDALRLDEEGAKLEAEVNKAKEEYQKLIYKEKLKNHTALEKVPDVLTKWRRGFLLSSPVTLAKLTAAAAQRMFFTPLEEAVGAGLGKLPGVSTIAENAPREGGFSGSAEARSLVDAFTKGMSDAANVLKTGKGVLDQSAGHKPGEIRMSDVAPRALIDLFGNFHGALKAPVKRAEFTRSFAKRVQFAEAHGVDISDPMVQTRIATEAYKDANRSIFMQDNIVTDAYKRALSRFEQVNKETGKPELAGQAAATALKVMLPIIKVPTNIVGETFTYSTGALTGTAKTIHAALTKGLENLTPNESDLILRQLKKGSVGAAVLLYGYFNPDMFGGYYQAGEMRKKEDVAVGGARVGGLDIPRFLLHNPAMEQFQIGATIRRVADSKLSKHDKETQGELSGAIAAGLGLVEEVPFAREAVEAGKIFDPHERAYAGGELLKSMFVPAVVSWMANITDKDAEGNTVQRKPKTALEHIETGIPGLRQNVPEKNAAHVIHR